MQEKIKKMTGARAVLILLSVVMLFAAFPVAGSAKDAGDMKLCPGGMAFGVRLYTKGVLVVGISEVKSGGRCVKPAKDAGIKTKDVILTAEGKETDSVKDLSDAIADSDGGGIKLTLSRDGREMSVTLTPVKGDDGRYQAGLWLRDTTAGIGTVTFIDPDTGEFGGLGHGICDIDTGELMPLKRGTAMSVAIGGIVKGKSGKPGEIKGYLLPGKCGSVSVNSDRGVFGAFTGMPDALPDPLPVGTRNDVTEGKAQLICTLGDDGAVYYDIEISKIDRDGRDNRNFVVKVTDRRLKERAGGIIQGMSGSPIIQNGRLVGAVTHVMVSDPAVGYGIFIENMLDAMSEGK